MSRLRPVAHLASIKLLWTLVRVLAQSEFYLDLWCFFWLKFFLFVYFQLDYFWVRDIHASFSHIIITSSIHSRHQLIQALLSTNQLWTVLAHILVEDQGLTFISGILLYRNAFLEVGFLAGLDNLPSDDRRWERAALAYLGIIDNS